MSRDREHALASYFDRVAREGSMDFFTPDQEVRLTRFWDLWKVTSGRQILEPGCGSGRLTQRLAQAVAPDGQVLAFDFSLRMIQTARARLRHACATVVLASVYSIPAHLRSFDQVICLNSFPHFSEPQLALSEMGRVLKPGGDLWINHFDSRSVVNERHRASGPEIAEHLLPSLPQLTELLQQAAFDLVEHSDSDQGYWAHARRRA